MDEQPPSSPRVEAITERQLEVARLVAAGRTNPEIADDLGVSLAGAKYHVSELLGRLGLERREEIADWYRREHGGRSVRELIATPVGWLVGGGAVAVAALLVVAAFVLLRDEASSPYVARPVASALETVETPQGRWEVLPAPPVVLEDHFAVALGEGKVLFAGVGSGAPGEATRTIPSWVLDLDTSSYAESDETHPWTGQVFAVRRPDETVVVAAVSPAFILRDPDFEPGLGAPSVAGERSQLLNQLRVWDPDTGEFSPLEVTLDSWDPERLGLGVVAGLGLSDSGDLIMPRQRVLAGGSTGTWPLLVRYDKGSNDLIELADIRVPAGTLRAGESLIAVVGGDAVILMTDTSLAIFDVHSGHVTSIGAGDDGVARQGARPSAAWLADGRLLLSGGYEPDDWSALIDASLDERLEGVPGYTADYQVLSSSEIPASSRVDIVDPSSATIASAAPLPSPRVAHTATVIEDGRVLIAGGVPFGGWSRGRSEPPAAPPPVLYAPATDTYEELVDAPEVPPHLTATALADGSVLFLGTAFADAGRTSGESTAIRFTPAAP